MVFPLPFPQEVRAKFSPETGQLVISPVEVLLHDRLSGDVAHTCLSDGSLTPESINGNDYFGNRLFAKNAFAIFLAPLIDWLRKRAESGSSGFRVGKVGGKRGDRDYAVIARQTPAPSFPRKHVFTEAGAGIQFHRSHAGCRGVGSEGWEHGEFSQEWMDSRFRGNDGVGVCRNDGVGRPRHQTFSVLARRADAVFPRLPGPSRRQRSTRTWPAPWRRSPWRFVGPDAYQFQALLDDGTHGTILSGCGFP